MFVFRNILRTQEMNDSLTMLAAELSNHFPMSALKVSWSNKTKDVI